MSLYTAPGACEGRRLLPPSDGDRRDWASAPAGDLVMASGGLVADFQSSCDPLPAHIEEKVFLGGSDDQMENGELQVGPALAFGAKGKSHCPCSAFGCKCEMDEVMSLDALENAKKMPSCFSKCMPGLLPSPSAKFCMGMDDHRGAGSSPPTAQHLCTSGVCLNAGCSVSQQKPNFCNAEAPSKPWGSVAFGAKGKSHSPCSVFGCKCEKDEVMSLDALENAKKMPSDFSKCMPGLLPSPSAKFCMGMADHRGSGSYPPTAQHFCTSGVCLNAGCSVSQQKPNFCNAEAPSKPWGSVAFGAKGKSHSPCSAFGCKCEKDEVMSLDALENPKKMPSDFSKCMPGLLPSPSAKFCMGMADHRGSGSYPPTAQHLCTSGVCLNAGCSVCQQKPNFCNAAAPSKPWCSVASAWKMPKVVPMPPLEELGRFSEDGSTAILDDDEVNATLRKLENALVGRMFARRIPYTQLSIELKHRWEVFGGFRLVMLSRDCFLCIFDRLEACEAVLMGGPWVVLGQVLGIDRWTSSFSPSSSEVFKTPVWIRMPGLPLYCWSPKNIARISALIGEPLWLDSTTEQIERGVFARSCIRIDLSKPLKSGVWVAGIHGRFFQPLEYEGLSLFCFRCSQVGHKVHSCKMPAPMGVSDKGPLAPAVDCEASPLASLVSDACAGQKQAESAQAVPPTPNVVRSDEEQVLVQQSEDRGVRPWMRVARRRNSNKGNGARMHRNPVVHAASNWDMKEMPIFTSVGRAGAAVGGLQNGRGTRPLPPPAPHPSQPLMEASRSVLDSGKPGFTSLSWADSADDGQVNDLGSQPLQHCASSSQLGKVRWVFSNWMKFRSRRMRDMRKFRLRGLVILPFRTRKFHRVSLRGRTKTR